jgi:S1-C subfamily serine protease
VRDQELDVEIEDPPEFEEPASAMETNVDGSSSRGSPINDFGSLQLITLDTSSGAPLGMKLKIQKPSASLQPVGLLVSSVDAAGLAASGGIVAGDIVQRINGEDVTASGSMQAVGGLIRGARLLELAIVRSGN